MPPLQPALGPPISAPSPISVLILGDISELCASKLLHYSPLSARCQDQENKKRQTKSHHLLGRKRRRKNTGIEFLFFSRNTHPSICGSESPSSRLSPSLPLTLILSLCFSFSLMLSLCGILAAILALGSHLSFGGTHAFLLADGTPTRAHTHVLLEHTHTLSLRDPTVLKIKRPTEDMQC